jgi:hypothetical protein
MEHHDGWNPKNDRSYVVMIAVHQKSNVTTEVIGDLHHEFSGLWAICPWPGRWQSFQGERRLETSWANRVVRRLTP